ncbi:MAG: metal ABC transporter ATP-binding protein [Chloroflexi bacterium]|nr:metal ABC transporter ATP-binding protein [Chloroflexota bacterium]
MAELSIRALLGAIPDQPAWDRTSSPQVMTVNALSASYNGHPALHDVSFNVYAGERIGIVGPNGAGKSTLFKAIVGLLPHQGAISIQGASCRQSHTMVGYVPQHEVIDWNFPATVWDVVMMGRARQIGYILPPRKRDRQAVQAALERVEMWPLRKRQIGELSGGQRRRVFVARALAQQASVLLLDEPFSGVDAQAESEIFQVLDVLRAEGVAVLLATHNLAQAATHYDKLMMLNGGRVLAYGTPAEVYTPENLAATFGGRIALWRDGDQYVLVADRPCHDHDCLEHPDHAHEIVRSRHDGARR